MILIIIEKNGEQCDDYDNDDQNQWAESMEETERLLFFCCVPDTTRDHDVTRWLFIVNSIIM
jgi:hypothetical protein